MTRPARLLGAEYAAALGAPAAPALREGAFAAGLALRVARDDRRTRRRRLFFGAAGAAAALAAALLLRVALDGGRDAPAAPVSPEPLVATESLDAVSREEDAALLLATARVRLEGFGDPKAGLERLARVARDFPGTAAARAAAAWIESYRKEGEPR